MRHVDILHDYIERFRPDRFHLFLQRLAEEFCLMAQPRRPIPVARAPVLLPRDCLEHCKKAARLLWGVLGNEAYQRRAAAHIPRQIAPEGRRPNRIALDPGCTIGCLDFHLQGDRLKLIEMMALPPGMVGIFPGLLARYREFLEETLGSGTVDPIVFMEGWDRHRAEQRLLEHIAGKGKVDAVAIVDWEPHSQITYGEFLYSKRLIEGGGQGPRCVVADPREVALKGGRPWVGGLPVDRILNRVTMADWLLHIEEIGEYGRLLFECPEVFVYDPYLWFLADKRALVLLSDPETLSSSMGLDLQTAAEITELVPLARMLDDFYDARTGSFDLETLGGCFGSAADIVVKPVSSHASKGILYGPCHCATEAALAERIGRMRPGPGDYIVMKRIPPPEMPYPTGRGEAEPWKFDIRIYIMDGEMVWAGGRIYLGEYTNQLPCRYFAPLFFV